MSRNSTGFSPTDPPTLITLHYHLTNWRSQAAPQNTTGQKERSVGSNSIESTQVLLQNSLRLSRSASILGRKAILMADPLR